MTSNKTIGNHFEGELCDLLAEAGWWAHNMAQNQIGQPADVIAVRNNIPVLIDCKVCENDRFPLSRIESNQEGAMTLWEVQGNTYCYFAMKLSDGTIYMVDFDSLSLRSSFGQGSLNKDEIRKYFPTLSEWLEVMNDDD
jgi:Holliday junction resolvase